MFILTEYGAIANLDNMIAIYKDYPKPSAKYHNILADFMKLEQEITLASFETEDQAQKAIQYIAGRLSRSEGADQVINMENVKDIITNQG